MNKKTFLLGLLITLLVGNFQGCGTHQGGIPGELKFAPLPSPSRQAMEYRIHSGDQLDVKFAYNPEFSETIPVRPDGRISLQLIGDITAAGLTPAELVAELERRYSKELRHPVVAVIVKSFSGEQVFVDGEVGNPGAIPLGPRLTVWQAIIKAGGFKDTATRESIIVIRVDEHNRVVPYRLDLKTTSLDQPQIAFQLQPFDVVVVPKTWVAEADKFVKQYVEDLLLFRGWYFFISPTPGF